MSEGKTIVEIPHNIPERVKRFIITPLDGGKYKAEVNGRWNFELPPIDNSEYPDDELEKHPEFQRIKEADRNLNGNANLLIKRLFGKVYRKYQKNLKEKTKKPTIEKQKELTLKQLSWLCGLEKYTNSPIAITSNIKMKGNWIQSAWYPLDAKSPFRRIDNRSVLDREIIFDIDATKWSVVKHFRDKIVEVLEMEEIPYYEAYTGGKGVHIHVFFETYRDKEDRGDIDEAKKYKLQYRDIRVYFWNWILDKADIDKKYRGSGKVIDKGLVGWSDYGKGHMIRLVGGRKSKINNLGEDTHKRKHIYAEWLKTRQDIPLEEIEFPEITPWIIPKTEFTAFLKEFIELKKNRPEATEIIEYEGKFLKLPCVSRIRGGMPEGKRNSGLRNIMLACSLDKIKKETAEKIADEYSKVCDKELLKCEKDGWINWAYDTTKSIYWSCGLSGELGVCDEKLEKDCLYNKEKFKEEMELLDSPTLLFEIKKELDRKVVGENETKLLLYLCCMSLKLPYRLNAQITGESSAGKTWVTINVLDLLPEENRFDLTRISPTALDHLENVNWDDFILFVGEGSGAQAAIETIKMYTDNVSGGSKVLVSEKDESGKIRAVLKQSKGYPVFITTSAKLIEDVEFTNRLLTIGVDLSDEQTDRICKMEIDNRTKPWVVKENNPKRRGKIRNIFNLLKKVSVIIPFASSLEGMFESNNIRTRRDFPKFLNIIEASACLFQRQRSVVEKKIGDNSYVYIVAEPQDLYNAVILGEETIMKTTKGIEESSNVIYKKILSSIDKIRIYDEIEGLNMSFDIFNISNLMKISNFSRSRLSELLKSLSNVGYLDFKKVGRENYYWLSKGGDSPRSIVDRLDWSRVVSEWRRSLDRPFEENLGTSSDFYVYNPLKNKKVNILANIIGNTLQIPSNGLSPHLLPPQGVKGEGDGATKGLDKSPSFTEERQVIRELFLENYKEMKNPIDPELIVLNATEKGILPEITKEIIKFMLNKGELEDLGSGYIPIT